MLNVLQFKIRHLPAAFLAALFFAGMIGATSDARADNSVSPPKLHQSKPKVRTFLSTGTTITGQPIQYPTGAPAKVTAAEITLKPGEQTGWHTHPVPMLGYMLEGELTVDYGPLGKRIYRKGDTLVEAMNEPHNGRNTGKGLMRILVVIMGAEGKPGSIDAPPPARAN